MTNFSCLFCKHIKTSILCHNSEATNQQFDLHKVSSNYKKGEYLFKEGFLPKGLYCINSGKIKLSKIGEHGKEQILRLIKPGDLVGYRAILSGEHNSASAIIIEDANICFISKEVFLNSIRNDNSFAMQFLKLLSTDIRKADQSIIDMAQKSVKELTAEVLLLMKETYGYKADNLTLDIKLSREELANLVGTSAETVVRFLTEFKRNKVIELIGKEIQILNETELLKLADMNG